MALEHGVYTKENDTAGFAIVEADTAIPFIIGLAPVNMSNPENVNQVVLCNNLTEFTEAFGTSKDLMKFTLVQAAKVYLTLYGTGPVFMVNVLDPKNHITAETTETLEVLEGKTVLKVEGVLHDSVKITDNASSAVLVSGTDYILKFDDSGYTTIYVMTAHDKIDVMFKALDASQITKDEIIGGVDPVTYKRKGLELIHEAFPKYRKVPGMILAPGYSHDSEVAAIMETKTKNINGVF
jgi:phage tail sheath protein FI